LFHADERTHTANLIVAFRNFAKAPKQESLKVPGVDGEIKI